MLLSLPLALHGLASSPCQTRAMSRRRAPASRPGLQRRWGGAWETCLPWCPACGRRSICGVRFGHERPSRCHRGWLWRDGLLWCQAQRCSVTAQPGGSTLHPLFHDNPRKAPAPRPLGFLSIRASPCHGERVARLALTPLWLSSLFERHRSLLPPGSCVKVKPAAALRMAPLRPSAWADC